MAESQQRRRKSSGRRLNSRSSINAASRSSYMPIQNVDDDPFDPRAAAVTSQQPTFSAPIAYGIQAGPAVAVNSSGQVISAAPAALPSSIHAAASSGVVFAVRQPPTPARPASGRVRAMAILSLVFASLYCVLNIAAWIIFGATMYDTVGYIILGLLTGASALVPPSLNMASVNRPGVHGQRAMLWTSFGFHIWSVIVFLSMIIAWMIVDFGCSWNSYYFSSWGRGQRCAADVFGNVVTIFYFLSLVLSIGVLSREMARKRSIHSINAALARPMPPPPASHFKLNSAAIGVGAIAWVGFAATMASMVFAGPMFMLIMYLGGLALLPQIAAHRSLGATHQRGQCCNWSCVAVGFGSFMLVGYVAMALNGLTFMIIFGLFNSYGPPDILSAGLFVSGVLGAVANSLSIHVGGKELRRTGGGCCCNTPT